jgi:hypothetical protein
MATTTRKPKVTKTSAELKQALEIAKNKVKELEQRAYAEEIAEFVQKTNIVSSFNVIKANVKGATEVAILAEIGKAAGILRLQITQLPAPKRAAADPSKPKKTRSTTKKAVKSA